MSDRATKIVVWAAVVALVLGSGAGFLSVIL